MNLYIEQPKGSNIVVIELPKEHITRKETCPYCSQHLVETFAQKSDRPKDPMKVLYGHRYALWWESLKIFCLNCRTVFTHQPSSRLEIKEYLRLSNESISRVVTTAGFNTKNLEVKTKSVSKGLLLYVVGTSKKHSFAETMYEIKPGYKKEDGYAKSKAVKFLNKKFQLTTRIDELWKKHSGIYCATSIENLLNGRMFLVPDHVLQFPKKS